MAKGSGFTRAVQYFRTADLTEARACLASCVAAIQSREAEIAPPRRKRRTKVEIANAATTGGTSE